MNFFTRILFPACTPKVQPSVSSPHAPLYEHACHLPVFEDDYPIATAPVLVVDTENISITSHRSAELPYSTTQTVVNTVSVPPPPTVAVFTSSDPALTQSTERPYGFEIFVLNDNAHIDIVAIHGLDGHRVNSWTANNNALWLRDPDFLPKLIPDARVLSWGYDGRTHGNTPMSCQTINDHAIALIAELSAFRRVTNTVGRPIIFIAHGVGGTIIKDALIYANAASKKHLGHYHDIKISTTGILFFGTPHQRISKRRYLRMSFHPSLRGGRINKPLLRDLMNPETLYKQLTQYNYIADDFETKFFYEAYAPARSTIVVPRHAAILPGAKNAETFVIHSDHQGLVKYPSTNDANYEKVSKCLLLMAEEARGAR